MLPFSNIPDVSNGPTPPFISTDYLKLTIYLHLSTVRNIVQRNELIQQQTYLRNFEFEHN